MNQGAVLPMTGPSSYGAGCSSGSSFCGGADAGCAYVAGCDIGYGRSAGADEVWSYTIECCGAAFSEMAEASAGVITR